MKAKVGLKYCYRAEFNPPSKDENIYNCNHKAIHVYVMVRSVLFCWWSMLFVKNHQISTLSLSLRFKMAAVCFCCRQMCWLWLWPMHFLFINIRCCTPLMGVIMASVCLWCGHHVGIRTEAKFLDEIQTNVLRVFLLPQVFHQSPLHSFALRFIFLQTHATFYVFLQHTVKEENQIRFPMF